MSCCMRLVSSMLSSVAMLSPTNSHSRDSDNDIYKCDLIMFLFSSRQGLPSAFVFYYEFFILYGVILIKLSFPFLWSRLARDLKALISHQIDSESI